MARDKLTEYSATASENTVCGDVNIAENSALPSDMNNYAREIMTHLKNFSDGTDAIDALAVDNLKLDGNTISSTDTNGDITLDPNGTGSISLDSGVVINESGANADFRVESDGNANMLFVDASANNFGVGHGSPNRTFHVSSPGAEVSFANTNMSADRRTMNFFMSSDKAHWRMLNDAGDAGGGAVTLDFTGNMTVPANLTASGTVFGDNQILQVVKATHSSTTQLTSSGAAHELTSSLRLSITPKASDSLLYLNFFAPFAYPNSNNLQYAYFYDVTNTASVGLPTALGARMSTTWAKRTTAFDANDMDTINMSAVIGASNTNARTYTIYHRTEGAVAQFLQSTLGSAAGTATVMFFYIMEVAA